VLTSDVSLLTDPIQDRPVRPVVIAPTYNNVQTLEDILTRIEALGLSILVVNDGSSDGTAQILANHVSDQCTSSVTVITHPQNRGKAAALTSGFTAAIKAGFTHAVTIDTDGQLDPKEIPALLHAARANPEALIIGRRDDQAE
jgi:glycosyltransferase involved in cell wall biosynthesis